MTSLPSGGRSGGNGGSVGSEVAHAYFQTWYAAHKTELADRRQHRYHSDPKYRQEVLAQSRRRYERLRQEKLNERAKNPEPPRTRGPNPPQEIVVCGEAVLVYSVSEFADRVDRNVQTITKWEKDKIIPPPTWVDEFGRRWYSDYHMTTVAATAHAFRARGGRRMEDFRALVDEAFAAPRK